MIYVDALMEHGAPGKYRGPLSAQAERVGARNGHRWCHLFSDEQDPAFPELRAFARRIGMKDAWFQGDHFDLTPGRRAAAVKAGAREATRTEAVAIWRAQRAAGIGRRPVKQLSPEMRARIEAGHGTFPGDLLRQPSGHTRHCEARMKWGDGECECGAARRPA